MSFPLNPSISVSRKDAITLKMPSGVGEAAAQTCRQGEQAGQPKDKGKADEAEGEGQGGRGDGERRCPERKPDRRPESEQRLLAGSLARKRPGSATRRCPGTRSEEGKGSREDASPPGSAAPGRGRPQQGAPQGLPPALGTPARAQLMYLKTPEMQLFVSIFSKEFLSLSPIRQLCYGILISQ